MKWFNNISIRGKLFLVFGLLACLMVFFALYADAQIFSRSGEINDLIESYQSRQIYISNTTADVNRIRLANLSRGYLFDDQDFDQALTEARTHYTRDVDSLITNLSLLRDAILSGDTLSPSERQELMALDSIEHTLGMYLGHTDLVLAATERKDMQEVVIQLEAAIPVGNELTDKVHYLRDLLYFETRSRAADISDSAAQTVRAISISTIGVILASVLMLLYTVNSITRPISQLETATLEIAGGNLDYPIRNDRGDELGVLSNRIGDMIQKLTEAESASVAKSSFLANMSHEIRTPMNVIMGITEILMRDAALLPDTWEALSKIYDSGDLLLNIINDILDLSKIEARKLELIPAEYQVASLVSDTTTLNIMRIGSKRIVFTLSIDENMPSSLYGDELRIRQILNNLLSNAFKYTAEGQVELSISVEAEIAAADLGASVDADANADVDASADVSAGAGADADAGAGAGASDADTDAGETPRSLTLVLTVSDTGQGMTREQLAMLFDEYARFDTRVNRTAEGTGLGMSITHNLVHMMGGSITVASKLGEGSTFTVRLPQRRIGEGVLGEHVVENLRNFSLHEMRHVNQAHVVFEPMPYGRILIIDDVESNVYVAKGLMAPYGLSIDSASSGFAAIDKVQSGELYDIIFMDHMMPNMDGMEAVRRIRALGYQAPIVALTANAVIGQSDVFLANGFDGFISKPIDVRQLNAILKKFIQDKQPPEVIEAAWHASADGDGQPGAGTPWRQGAESPVQPGAGMLGQSTHDVPTRHALSPQLIETFLWDARGAVTKVGEILAELEESGTIGSEGQDVFTVTAHGMKSALANVGESALSAVAAGLEQASRAGRIESILSDAPAFLLSLQSVIDRLTLPASGIGASSQRDSARLTDTGGQESLNPLGGLNPLGSLAPLDSPDVADLLFALRSIQEASDVFDRQKAKDTLTQLREGAWPAPISEGLGKLAEHLLNGDFEMLSSDAERMASNLSESSSGG
ncbi:MAG: ATP-binding protein [Clostridiales bacterium]|nr:ATP-binding protein [Clostridiales bacterium]